MHHLWYYILAGDLLVKLGRGLVQVQHWELVSLRPAYEGGTGHHHASAPIWRGWFESNNGVYGPVLKQGGAFLSGHQIGQP